MLQLAAQRNGRNRAAPVRIIVVQTPLEKPSPDMLTPLWAHFNDKGFAVEMDDSGLNSREDCFRPELIARLKEADLVCITGGSPERAFREMNQTPALIAMAEASRSGVVIAGCSAGALVFGQGMMSGKAGQRLPFPMWGWFSEVLIAPHFGCYDIQEWQRSYPDCAILGIPNDAMLLMRGKQIESLGPEPLMIIPRGKTEPIKVIAGRIWALP